MDPACWWEDHLQKLAHGEHHRALIQERRAQVLAGGTGSAVVGGLALYDAGWVRLSDSLSLGAAGLGVLGLVLAFLVFGMSFWPMEGRKFRAGSVEEWFFGTLSDGNGWLGWLVGAPRVPHRESVLSFQVQQAIKEEGHAEGNEGRAASAHARRLVAEFLHHAVKTELSWWLTPENESEAARRVVDVRYRLVFSWWAARQVGRVKADLVRAGLRLCGLSVALIALALVWEALGWWVLLIGLVGAGLWVRKEIL